MIPLGRVDYKKFSRQIRNNFEEAHLQSTVQERINLHTWLVGVLQIIRLHSRQRYILFVFLL